MAGSATTTTSSWHRRKLAGFAPSPPVNFTIPHANLTGHPAIPRSLHACETKTRSVIATTKEDRFDQPKQALVDPLADVPLFGLVTDRFEIQPGDTTLITVGSIEVVTHPSAGKDKTGPHDTAGKPAGQATEGGELAIATLSAPNFITDRHLYSAAK
jgi:hypothetical protein